MLIGGDIKATGPELSKGSLSLSVDEVDFDLETQCEIEKKVSYYLWFKLDEDDHVSISNSVKDGVETIECNSFCLSFKDSDANKIEIEFSLTQVEEVKNLLENFLNLKRAYQILSGKSKEEGGGLADPA